MRVLNNFSIAGEERTAPLWRFRCDECGQNVDIVVQCGDDPPDVEASVANLCRDCLKAALCLIETTLLDKLGAEHAEQ